MLEFIELSDLARQRVPVHARHLDIDERRVEGAAALFHDVERFDTVRRFRDRNAKRFERFAHDGTVGFAVVDNQNIVILRRTLLLRHILAFEILHAAFDTFRHIHQCPDIHDQRDASVTANRRTGDSFDPLEIFAQRLDDDLLLPDKRIDDEAQFGFGEADDDDIGVLAHTEDSFDIENIGKMNERKHFVTQPQNASPFDTLNLVGCDAYGFQNRRQRNRIILFLYADQKRLDDGERQRYLEFEYRPFPGLGIDFDNAVELFDIGFDNIHTDTPARYIGHFRSRREARFENKHEGLFVAHLIGLLLTDETFFHRLHLQHIGIEPLAVVDDFDDDMVPFVVGFELYCTFGRLPFGNTLFR